MSTTADLIALEEEDDELIAPLPGDALPSEEPLFVSDEELPTATSFKSAYERFESAHSFAPIELEIDDLIEPEQWLVATPSVASAAGSEWHNPSPDTSSPELRLSSASTATAVHLLAASDNALSQPTTSPRPHLASNRSIGSSSTGAHARLRGQAAGGVSASVTSLRTPTSRIPTAARSAKSTGTPTAPTTTPGRASALRASMPCVKPGTAPSHARTRSGVPSTAAPHPAALRASSSDLRASMGAPQFNPSARTPPPHLPRTPSGCPAINPLRLSTPLPLTALVGASLRTRASPRTPTAAVAAAAGPLIAQSPVIPSRPGFTGFAAAPGTGVHRATPSKIGTGAPITSVARDAAASTAAPAAAAPPPPPAAQPSAEATAAVAVAVAVPSSEPAPESEIISPLPTEHEPAGEVPGSPGTPSTPLPPPAPAAYTAAAATAPTAAPATTSHHAHSHLPSAPCAAAPSLTTTTANTTHSPSKIPSPAGAKSSCSSPASLPCAGSPVSACASPAATSLLLPTTTPPKPTQIVPASPAAALPLAMHTPSPAPAAACTPHAALLTSSPAAATASGTNSPATGILPTHSKPSAAVVRAASSARHSLRPQRATTPSASPEPDAMPGSAGKAAQGDELGPSKVAASAAPRRVFDAHVDCTQAGLDEAEEAEVQRAAAALAVLCSAPAAPAAPAAAAPVRAPSPPMPSTSPAATAPAPGYDSKLEAQIRAVVVCHGLVRGMVDEAVTRALTARLTVDGCATVVAGGSTVTSAAAARGKEGASCKQGSMACKDVEAVGEVDGEGEEVRAPGCRCVIM